MFNEWGGTLHLPDRKAKITGIELAYFNNKKEPKTYTFLMNQYFDLPVDSKEFESERDILNGLSFLPPISIECESFEVNEAVVLFMPATRNRSIKLVKNSEEEGKQIVEWKRFLEEETPITKSMLSQYEAERIDKTRK